MSSVCILVLIHHNIFKPFLEIFQYIRACLEQFHCFHNQIIKIQCIILFQLFLVFFICQSYFSLREVPHNLQLIFLWTNQLILCAGNSRHNGSFLINLCINIKPFANILHQSFLIICIINCKIRIKAQSVNKTAKHANTAGMKCRYPYALGTKSYNLIHSFSHLSCCFIGKSNRQNVPRRDSFFFY